MNALLSRRLDYINCLLLSKIHYLSIQDYNLLEKANFLSKLKILVLLVYDSFYKHTWKEYMLFLKRHSHHKIIIILYIIKKINCISFFHNVCCKDI